MNREQALERLAAAINWQQHDEGGVTTFEVCDHRLAPFIFASYSTLAEAQADVAARTEVALAEMWVPDAEDAQILMQRELDAANAAREKATVEAANARLALAAAQGEAARLAAENEALKAVPVVESAPPPPAPEPPVDDRPNFGIVP